MRRLAIPFAITALALASCGAPLPDPGMPEAEGVLVSDLPDATIGLSATSRNVAITPSLAVMVAWYEPTGRTVRVSRSTDRGLGFAPSVELFTVPGTSAPPEVSIATGGVQRVYVAFLDDERNLRLARSTNGGASWGPAAMIASGPFSGGDLDQLSLAARDDLVLVAVARPAATVLLRSTDGGGTFTEVATTLGGKAFWDVLIDPRDGTVIVIGDDPGIDYAVSADGGSTFGTAVDPLLGALYSDYAIGTDGRVLVVGSGGEAWLWDLDADAWHGADFGVMARDARASAVIDADGSLHVLSTEDGIDVMASSSTDGGIGYTTVVVARGSEFDVAAAPHVAGLAFVVAETGTVRYHFVPNP